MDKNEIKKKISKELPFLKDKYHVKEVGIFGSVVRNEHKEGSDIDILIEFSSPIGFFDFIRLENFLSEILESKVDLVSKKAIKSAVRENILSEVVYV